MKLGERLRLLREQRKWTQPQAAATIGIEQSYLSKLENDHSVPSVDVFRRIVGAYETDVGAIVEGLDPGNIAQLTQVPDIADYLGVRRRSRQARRRRRTTLQTFAVALGACLIYAGLSELFFPSATAGQAWMNRMVTFVGIFSLTYGLIGLLVASARRGVPR